MTRPLSDAGPLNCPFCGAAFDSEKGPQFQAGEEEIFCGCGLEVFAWFSPAEPGAAKQNLIEHWNRRASSASAGTLTKEDWSDIRSALINAADRTPFAAREKRWLALAAKLAALADAPATLRDKENEKP